MKTQLLNFLFSDTGLALLVSIFGTIWAAIKGTGAYISYYEWIQRNDLGKAEAVVMEGVHQIYVEFAQAWKAADAPNSPSGKLSPQQQADARKLATARAIEIGQQMGVDVAKIIGPQLLESAVVLAVKKLKGPVTGPQLPASTQALF